MAIAGLPRKLWRIPLSCIVSSAAEAMPLITTGLLGWCRLLRQVLVRSVWDEVRHFAGTVGASKKCPSPCSSLVYACCTRLSHQFHRHQAIKATHSSGASSARRKFSQVIMSICRNSICFMVLSEACS